MPIPYGPIELDLPLEDVLGAPELVWPTPSPPEMSEEEVSKTLHGGRLWFSTSSTVLPRAWRILAPTSKSSK